MKKFQWSLKRSISLFSKDHETVSFDIAVTAEDSSSKGAGIKVLQVVSAGVASEVKQSTTSRIKFSVNVHSKTKEEEKNDLEKYRQLKQ